MIQKICYIVSTVTVVLATVLGLVAVWFENLLPTGFIGKSLSTLSIVFAAAVVCAIVTVFNTKE